MVQTLNKKFHANPSSWICSIPCRRMDIAKLILALCICFENAFKSLNSNTYRASFIHQPLFARDFKTDWRQTTVVSFYCPERFVMLLFSPALRSKKQRLNRNRNMSSLKHLKTRNIWSPRRVTSMVVSKRNCKLSLSNLSPFFITYNKNTMSVLKNYIIKTVTGFSRS